MMEPTVCPSTSATKQAMRSLVSARSIWSAPTRRIVVTPSIIAGPILSYCFTKLMLPEAVAPMVPELVPGMSWSWFPMTQYWSVSVSPLLLVLVTPVPESVYVPASVLEC